MADLWTADPLAAARTWLLSHPDVTAALGGENRVGSRNEPPYPCVVLTDTPGGSDMGLRWLMSPELTIAVYGDMDGTPGKAALRRILYIVLVSLKELASAAPAPGAAVITEVESSAPGGWNPLPSGQPRYQSAVRLFMHPPIPA